MDSPSLLCTVHCCYVQLIATKPPKASTTTITLINNAISSTIPQIPVAIRFCHLRPLLPFKRADDWLPVPLPRTSLCYYPRPLLLCFAYRRTANAHFPRPLVISKRVVVAPSSFGCIGCVVVVGVVVAVVVVVVFVVVVAVVPLSSARTLVVRSAIVVLPRSALKWGR